MVAPARGHLPAAGLAAHEALREIPGPGPGHAFAFGGLEFAEGVGARLGCGDLLGGAEGHVDRS